MYSTLLTLQLSPTDNLSESYAHESILKSFRLGLLKFLLAVIFLICLGTTCHNIVIRFITGWLLHWWTVSGKLSSDVACGWWKVWVVVVPELIHCNHMFLQGFRKKILYSAAVKTERNEKKYSFCSDKYYELFCFYSRIFYKKAPLMIQIFQVKLVQYK